MVSFVSKDQSNYDLIVCSDKNIIMITNIVKIVTSSITHSSVSLLVTSSISKAARVTFRVAFLGRIFFSPKNIFHKIDI